MYIGMHPDSEQFVNIQNRNRFNIEKLQEVDLEELQAEKIQLLNTIIDEPIDAEKLEVLNNIIEDSINPDKLKDLQNLIDNNFQCPKCSDKETAKEQFENLNMDFMREVFSLVNSTREDFDDSNLSNEERIKYFEEHCASVQKMYECLPNHDEFTFSTKK